MIGNFGSYGNERKHTQGIAGRRKRRRNMHQWWKRWKIMHGVQRRRLISRRQRKARRIASNLFGQKANKARKWRLMGMDGYVCSSGIPALSAHCSHNADQWMRQIVVVGGGWGRRRLLLLLLLAWCLPAAVQLTSSPCRRRCAIIKCRH